MNVNIKIFILVVVFILFIIIIYVSKDTQHAFLAIGFISSMLLLISACYGLVPKDPKNPEKEQYINFSEVFNNVKNKFSNQMNDGFDTTHTFDVTDEDTSLAGYDAETRYFIDPNVLDTNKLILDGNENGVIDDDELLGAVTEKYESTIDYDGFDDLRESINQMNEAKKIEYMRQKEINDYMNLTPEEKDNYYKYKNEKQYSIDQKNMGDQLKKPNCHMILPNQETVQAFKIYDAFRNPTKLVDDRSAEHAYKMGRRDIRAKTGMMEYSRRAAMLTSQVGDIDGRREWWNDNKALDLVIETQSKKKLA